MSKRELLIFLATVAGVGLAVVFLLRNGSSCSQRSTQVTVDGFMTTGRPAISRSSANEDGEKLQEVSSTPAPVGHVTSAATIPQVQSRVDYYKNQIIHPVKLNTKCTLLVPTYKRVRMLLLLLDNYCVMTDSLEKIVVVWNDISSAIPSTVSNLTSSCRVELKVLHMTVNKLSNRFLPGNYFNEIKTECVFVVDDDIFVSPEDMKFALESWQIFRKQIVGFEGRSKSFSILRDGSYFYHSTNQNGMKLKPSKGSYGIMLPAYFIHKAYLEMFFDPEMVPREFLDYTDEKFNCEDILFTMMVTKFVQDAHLAWSGGLCVEPRQKIKIMDVWGKDEHHGLVRRGGHMTTRTGCLNKFIKHYGETALVLSRVVLKPGSDWAEHYYTEGALKSDTVASKLWT